MSHQGTPEYYTLISICQYDGSPTVLGIFENMMAVSARLQACYSSCGDEYRIECFHLSTEIAETKRLKEILDSRAKAKADHLEEKADNNS